MSFADNPYKQMLTDGRKSLRPEDIKTYGVRRFLDEQAPRRGPLQLPKLHFTEEENRIMDEILAEERLPTHESEVSED
ncbi:hypothetical protein HHL22_13780 [Hymenobacter sp. RP-2-7]|uniref:Uncharacterized protein n=1 Tax=Hymenobacter polaris TaxID=2682546 RepID=A0A7Y0AF95_9BACT|nr:hypothetical protein [Hymenobacter polaris]NML66278.1 hypothetical protein [Hymenobacter polaris]